MTNVSKDIQTLYRTNDALSLSALVRDKEVTASELMECAIAATEKLNPQLNAVVNTNYADARSRAAQCDSAGLFAGVPFLAKDLGTRVAGLRTTNGSRFFHRHARPATEDNEVIRRLRKSGMLPFGNTNVPEYGESGTTECKLYGPARNPWNPAYSPGGSSGGAASAVAARIVPIAGASDGGGSTRQPASWCGLVGLMPSRGRVPAYPGVDLWYGGSALCVSRSVRDTAAYLDAVSGPCAGDSYIPPRSPDSFLQLSSQEPKRLRIGFSTSLPFGNKLDSGNVTALAGTARLLESMGHNLEPYDLAFDIETCWQARARIRRVMAAFAVQAAEKTLGATLTDDDIEPFTRAFVEEGKTIDAVTHAKDIEIIRYAGRDIAAELAPFDAFLCPVFAGHTYLIGEWDTLYDTAPAEAKISTHAFLFPFNVSGLPAISLPFHELHDGLPMGVQLVARYGDEATLLQIANALERHTRWDQRQPSIVDGFGAN